jgi:hypothetical protein
METLDNKIIEIFNNLIESRTKYIDCINYYGQNIVYNLGPNLRVHLILQRSIEPNVKENQPSTIEDLFSKNSEIYFQFPQETGHINFLLVINEKTYYVPKMDRINEARTLSALEETIAEYESDVLDKVYKKIELEEYL